MQEKTFNVNNEIYHHLGDAWYEAKDDPIALLRAESKFRNPWIYEILKLYGIEDKILDMGCGGGFLSNFLASKNLQVSAVDLSKDALQVARKQDFSQTVQYEIQDVSDLSYNSNSFSAVCAMDLLEHVEDPQEVIGEASRVLEKEGLFFFYTFNRNILAELLVIKSLEWFLPKTPKNLHVVDYFIKPKEMQEMCKKAGLQVLEMKGVKPKIFQKAILNLIQGRVSEKFQFEFTSSLQVAYMGYAIKI